MCCRRTCAGARVVEVLEGHDDEDETFAKCVRSTSQVSQTVRALCEHSELLCQFAAL